MSPKKGRVDVEFNKKENQDVSNSKEQMELGASIGGAPGRRDAYFSP